MVFFRGADIVSLGLAGLEAKGNPGKAVRVVGALSLLTQLFRAMQETNKVMQETSKSKASTRAR